MNSEIRKTYFCYPNGNKNGNRMLQEMKLKSAVQAVDKHEYNSHLG